MVHGDLKCPWEGKSNDSTGWGNPTCARFPGGAGDAVRSPSSEELSMSSLLGRSMVNHLICSGILRPLVILLLGSGIIVAAPPVIVGPTLMLRPATADVERGANSEILLEAVPSNAGDIKFTISMPPAHGKLGEMRRKTPNSVVLTYTNNGDKEAEDEFVFRIKAPGKSWATETAIISVKDPVNSLEIIPNMLDFGKIGLGENSRRKLVLKNRLADSISGTLLLPAPWSIKGDGRYHLNYRESAEFSVFYEPHEETRSLATIQVLPSGNGPKLTLQGEAIKPFSVNTNAVVISPSGKSDEVTIQNQLDHEIIVKVVTDDLIAALPPIPLKPGTLRQVHLRVRQPSIKEMQTIVRLTYGEYDAEVAVTIQPPPQSTDQPSPRAESKKIESAKGRSDELKTSIAVRSNQCPGSENPANQHPTRIGTGLPHLPTGPVLLPEAEQMKLRRLLVSNISYFLKPGLFGWHLTLQWHCEDLSPREFLIERRAVVPTDHGGTNTEFQRINPMGIKSLGNGMWQAGIPAPPQGFQFLRIAPLLDGTKQTVYATFQIQMPPSSLIWNRYRIPAALALIISLVLLIRKIRRES